MAEDEETIETTVALTFNGRRAGELKMKLTLEGQQGSNFKKRSPRTKRWVGWVLGGAFISSEAASVYCTYLPYNKKKI